MTVDDVFEEDKKRKPDWDSFLNAPGNEGAKAADDRYAAMLKELDDMHDSLTYGDNEPPEQTTTPTAIYIGQHGQQVLGSAPHSGFTVVPGPNGQPKYSYTIDARAPLAKENGNFGLGLTPEADWRAQFQPRLAAVVAPRNTPSVTQTPAPAAAAPLLPSAYNTVGNAGRVYQSNPNILFSPYGTVERTSAPAFTPNAEMNLQPPAALKVSKPIANGVDWGPLPPSPLDQKDRDRYASL